MKKLITILGPTATGKTSVAALLAFHLDGEVISADSRQVYKGMDLGTGKDLQDYIVNGLKIPYHLIDIADPGYEYNVFEFQKDFLRVFEEINQRNKVPIMCGGSGLYLESVIDQYHLMKVPENENLRKTLNQYTHQALIQRLQSYKVPHNTTDTKDRGRLIRAIEIQEHALNSKANIPHFPAIHHTIFGIDFPRHEIRKRITSRLIKRIENGMIKEIETLLKQGLQPDQLTFYGLEYRYLTQYATGELSYEAMFQKLNTAIHQFAKRQMTWFRRMEKKGMRITWIDGYLPLERKVNFIIKTLENHA